jgi:hypothetical protein
MDDQIGDELRNVVPKPVRESEPCSVGSAVKDLEIMTELHLFRRSQVTHSRTPALRRSAILAFRNIRSANSVNESSLITSA